MPAIPSRAKRSPAKRPPARLPKRLAASDFYKYDSCPHWPWFDAFGDRKKKGKSTRFSEMLLEMGVLYEKDVIKGMEYVEVQRDGGQAARAKATLALMRQGVPRIYHGVLMTGDLIGEPDLLERREDRPSDLGQYHYVAVDIKSAERVSDAHKYQLSVYADLLQATQGRRPAHGYVLNGAGVTLAFELGEFEERYRTALADLRETLGGRLPAPHLSSGCKQSPWFGECKALAERTDDIALLYNVRKRHVLALRDAGVRTIHDAAKVDPTALSRQVSSLKRDLLERLVLQAEALLTRRHFVRRTYHLPRAPLEIFFDIEGDPLRGVEYLFGFLTREGERTVYIHMLAPRPEDEAMLWQQFIDWIEGLPQEYVVYHYGSYEKARITMLKGRHGGDGPALRRFVDRLVDLNELVKESIVFPLYFYGIKDIGKYIGFERQGKIVGGGESVAFYEEWLEKGNRKRLDDIIIYNEEDVVATLELKDWLAHEAQGVHEEMDAGNEAQ